MQRFVYPVIEAGKRLGQIVEKTLQVRWVLCIYDVALNHVTNCKRRRKKKSSHKLLDRTK